MSAMGYGRYENDDPELYEFVKAIKDDTELRNRFIAYIKGLTSK